MVYTRSLWFAVIFISYTYKPKRNKEECRPTVLYQIYTFNVKNAVGTYRNFFQIFSIRTKCLFEGTTLIDYGNTISLHKTEEYTIIIVIVFFMDRKVPNPICKIKT